MDILGFINNHLLIASLLVIALFLLFQFYLKPKYMNPPKKEGDTSNLPVQAPSDSKPDSFTKRTVRGFGVMMEKLRNSEYVKSIQEEQANAKSDDYLPAELKSDREEEDTFSTDMSKATKVDF